MKTRPFDAVSSALARTREVLFNPFESAASDSPSGAGGKGAQRPDGTPAPDSRGEARKAAALKYLAIGVAAWLYHLGSLGFRFPSTPGAGAPGPWPEVVGPFEPWMAPVGVALLAVGLLIWTGILFLQSRGSLMLIDNIARDRGALRDAWVEQAKPANSLFLFRLAVSLSAAAVAFVGATLVGVALWTTWEGDLTPPHVAILGVVGAAVGSVALVAAVAGWLADEFVAPLMFARGYGVGDGFRDLSAFVREDLGGFALYAALRLAAAVAVAVLAVVATVLSCGIAMLPLVGTLILLPALVFVRAFSLEFMGQLSEDLDAAFHPVPKDTIERAESNTKQSA